MPRTKMPQTKEEVELQAILTERLGEDSAKKVAEEAARFPDKVRRDIAEFMISEVKKIPEEKGEEFLVGLASTTLASFSSKTPEQVKQTIAILQTQPKTKTVDKVQPLSVDRTRQKIRCNGDCCRSNRTRKGERKAKRSYYWQAYRCR